MKKKKKKKISAKLVRMLVLSMFLVAIMLLAGSTYANYMQCETFYNDKALSVAKTASEQIDGDFIDRLYRELQTDEFRQLRASYDANGDLKPIKDWLVREGLHDEFLQVCELLSMIQTDMKVEYLYIQVIEDGNSFYLVDPTDPYEALGYAEELIGEFQNLTGNERVEPTVSRTELGWLSSGGEPILNSDEEACAVCFVDINMTEIVENIIRFAVYMGIFCVAALLFVGFLVSRAVKKSVSRPIGELTAYAQRISDGIFGEQIEVRSNDEIGEIADVFNRMSNSIARHMSEVGMINDAYHRYVPSQIFDLLKKQSVTDVSVGEYVKVNLSVMTFRNTDFQELARTMDAEKMYTFMNRIYRPLTTAVNEQGGFVARFSGDGFEAFHTESCENLLKAAIHMCRAMKGIFYGTAITYGEVMLGIVGQEQRNEAVFVSEQNNVAAYLSSICEKYAAHILMSATAAAQISNFEEMYCSRCIGYIYISASERSEKIYDVYDCADEDLKRLKEQTKETFEQGVNYYCTGEFDRARSCFIEVLKVFKADSASREYLYRCNRRYEEQQTDRDVYIEVY